VALAAACAVPAGAEATIDVSGATLRVPIGAPAAGSTSPNGAQVKPLSGGGVIVSLHGSANPSDMAVGAGCQQVSTSNADDLPGNFFSTPGARSPVYAATCDLTGVRIIEGRLNNALAGSQGWFSNINLPTNVTAVAGTGPNATAGVNTIITGPSGDRITGSAERDVIDAGGAPYKGQEALPPTGNTALDDPAMNIVTGAGGNDTFNLMFALGRDAVTGGAGVDLATYEGRFQIGPPGAAGVHVTLDGQGNDGDPNIDPPDSTAAGEGDNVGTDVENITGTKREDRLIGNGLANTLLGDEGVDTLTGAAGEDVLLAREPATAGVGTADVLSCGSPAPAPPPTKKGTTVLGIFSTPPGIDRLQADLADVKPADCEQLVDMAVDEGAPVKVARSARRAKRGTRLRVRLTCPRAAARRCDGSVRLAGRSRSGSKAARFSIPGGAKRSATLKLSKAAAKALRSDGVSARLVSQEEGNEGEVNTVSLVRVR
jgi:hypothetical protein